MNDINHLNRDRTQSYLPRCSVTMVVSKIGRVISDSQARLHLANAVRGAGPDHQVIMVCTFSEVASSTSVSGFSLTLLQDVQINSRSQTKFALEEGHLLEHLKREKTRFEQELRRLESFSNERQLQLIE